MTETLSLAQCAESEFEQAVRGRVAEPGYIGLGIDEIVQAHAEGCRIDASARDRFLVYLSRAHAALRATFPTWDRTELSSSFDAVKALVMRLHAPSDDGEDDVLDLIDYATLLSAELDYHAWRSALTRTRKRRGTEAYDDSADIHASMRKALRRMSIAEVKIRRRLAKLDRAACREPRQRLAG